MSKIKLSFSFLLTFMLVAMFSIVASAAGSTVPGYNPAVTTEGSVIQEQGEGKLAVDDTVNDNSYDTVDKSNANKTGSGVGGSSANFNNVIKSDDMVKNPDGTHGTQRTHGSYMNNTNSCASCHQTHTGASKNLLFKDGEYATCTACHDGTLGFYNVFSSSTTTTTSGAGTFGGTHDGNMSVHLANGTVHLTAAPGGNQNGTDNWTAEFTCASCHAPHGSYSDRLLHPDPNGMGNITIDKGGKKITNVPVVSNQDLTTLNPAGDFTYSDAAGNPVTVNFIINRITLDATNISSNPDYSAKGLVAGDIVLQVMKWNPDKKAADKVTPAPVYEIDTAPWLHGYDFDASHTNKIYWTTLKNDDGSKKFDTDQLKKGEVLGNGFAAVKSTSSLVSTVNALTKGDVARGYVVKLDLSAPDANNVTTSTASSLWASKLANGSNNPGYVANRGVAMSNFCSACHTDYLAKSGTESGTFDHAYRHTTTSDSYTCVRCHYAHGTDVTVMRDARGLTYDQIKADTTNYFPTVTEPTARETVVKDYLMDKNPSSALKRYTNMAVCWACHTSSHSEGTRNTDTYQYNSTPGIDTDRNGVEFDY